MGEGGRRPGEGPQSFLRYFFAGAGAGSFFASPAGAFASPAFAASGLATGAGLPSGVIACIVKPPLIVPTRVQSAPAAHLVLWFFLPGCIHHEPGGIGFASASPPCSTFSIVPLTTTA